MKLTSAVVIPTFRRPDFLIRAVSSALSQTIIPDEIIVVAADPSEAASLRSNLSKEFPGAPVFLRSGESNLIGGAARNLGVASTESDIIFFLDDDDRFEPKKISSHLSVHASGKIDVVYSEAILEYDDGERKVAKLVDSGTIAFRERIAQPGVCPSSTSCVSLRAAAFKDVGGFDSSLESYQDLDLWFRLACVGKTFFALREAHTTFSQHSSPRVSVGNQRRYRSGDVLIVKHGENREIIKAIQADREAIAGREAIVAAHAGKIAAIGSYLQSVLKGQTPAISRSTIEALVVIIWTLIKRHLTRKSRA